MIYQKDFKVSEGFLSDTSIKWRPTGNGEYILAEKGGKTYFIKRNIHVRYPSPRDPKAVYVKYKEAADALTEKQKQLKERMKKLDLKDHIVAEESNFWDAEGMFVTVTPFLRDLLPDDFDFTAIGEEQFLDMAKSMAGALEKLHAAGVIHGDLKEKNLPVRLEGGKYIPYFIDFDTAFPACCIPKPDEIGGSEGYQAPEVLLYAMKEGVPPKSITPAIDVFSLAIVLHRRRTGAFPATSMEGGSVGEAVCLGKEVILHPKCDFQIGERFSSSFLSLLNWMLEKEPEKRPTAEQVLKVLNDEASVPFEFCKGMDKGEIQTELWEVHEAVARLYSPAVLKKKGVVSLKKINEGCGSAGYKYLVRRGEKEERLSVEELCLLGLAARQTPRLDEPWEEDKITFLTPEQMSERGVFRIERVKGAYKRYYVVTTLNGRSLDRSREGLIREGLAFPKQREIKMDTPWPEHGSGYSAENMELFGIESISRIEFAGEHRYKIVYHEKEGGRNKTNENVPIKNLKLMGIIKQ